MNTTNLFADQLAKPKVIAVSTSTKGTYPPYEPITSATFTTNGKTVIFSGVKPNDNVKASYYLYSTSNDQVIRINSIQTVVNEVVGTLEESFATDVTTPEALNIVIEPKYRGVTINIQGAETSATIDGQEITLLEGQANLPISFFNPNGLQPIAYDSNTSSLIITITK